MSSIVESIIKNRPFFKKIWILGIVSMFIVAVVAWITTRWTHKLNTASCNKLVGPTFGHELLVSLGVICNQRNIFKYIYFIDQGDQSAYARKYFFFFFKINRFLILRHTRRESLQLFGVWSRSFSFVSTLETLYPSWLFQNSNLQSVLLRNWHTTAIYKQLWERAQSLKQFYW